MAAGVLCRWFCLLLVAGGGLVEARAQYPLGKISRIEIKHVGPPSVSEPLIRANLRVKPGDAYLPTAVDDDVRNLYATGLFYTVQVARENVPEGVVLTYVVQARPRLTEIKFHGNRKYTDRKLKKKLTSKVDELLDERKLFNDAQEIQKMYEKSGYPRTVVKYVVSIDEAAGKGTATFEVTEAPKLVIRRVEFEGARAFPQKKLRGQIKTRTRWMFSWLTGSGVLKEEQLDEDREKLREFYRNNGYIDFDIKHVNTVLLGPRSIALKFIVEEGKQYKVGSVQFTGNKAFTTAQITNGVRVSQVFRGGKYKAGPNGLPMDVGDVFSPKGLARDTEAVEDFYGAKGYVDASPSSGGLMVRRIPNTTTGTMDLEFKIDEGQQSKVEKIEIRGNTKTKDRVIRRELAVSPGEVFDMVRVKISKQRLEGLQYFEKVDARPEPSDINPAQLKNLVVSVDEKTTGHVTMGAGFSSVDAVVGFVEYYEANFDLRRLLRMDPWFQGGGQKFRLRVQLGTERQDYLMSFVEPWFLGRKLALGVDAYHREWTFQSLENLYDEVRTGGKVSLTRALWSDFFIGSVSYTLEDVGILFNPGAHGPRVIEVPGTGREPPTYVVEPATAPETLLREAGHSLLSKGGVSIAYDTRNSVALPNKGQRTELFAEVAGLGGDKSFYKLQVNTAWYFKGLFRGHVLELVGRAGVAEAFADTLDVPFYERFYLGGLYSLRGFKYRSISPREPGISEPIGGDTYWYGSAEYSIPIFQQEKERERGGPGVGVRLALFYDIGSVGLEPYDFNFSNFSDNWGIGLRLNLPIGPLRLDYGIPINYDKYNSGSGRFQFGVGYTREF